MQYAVDRNDRSPSTLPLYSSLFAGDFESALSHARAAIYAVEEDTVFEGPSLEMTKAGEAFGDYLQVMEFKDGPEAAYNLLKRVYDFSPLHDPTSTALGFPGPMSHYFYTGSDLPPILHSLSNPLIDSSPLPPPPLPLICLYVKLHFLLTPTSILNLKILPLPLPPTRLNYKSLLQLSRKSYPPTPSPSIGPYINSKTHLEKEYKSHYAFYKFITYLQTPPVKKNGERMPKQIIRMEEGVDINVLGDSHTLTFHSTFFHPICFTSHLCTGLKAKHFRDKTFMSYHIFLRELGRVSGTLFLCSVGEIDCREGIGGEVVQKYILEQVEWEEVEREIRILVERFVEELGKVCEDRGKRAFLLKVPKAGGAKKGRSLARKCKDKTVDAFNRLVTEITENNPWVNSLNYEVNDAEGIKPIFEGDGTHCNTRVAEVVGRIMKDLI
ncbi:hypothetical protein TrST_g5498 [Triparma strigata]|uniref:Uncharacterized protein n=1 Tax=Triparma strigata TaxID=1606541 RepID=A0A9W6ZXI2_9STRA|nr:hypothetical protein TrST_g5498 [Triparma strigata]